MPRTRTLTAAAGVVLAMTLTGCGTIVPGTPGPAGAAQRLQPELPTETPTTTTTPPEPTTNDRGLIPMTPGATATLEDGTGRELATFSIDSVEVDPPCHEYGIRPEAGHTLVLTVRASTGSDLEAAQTLSMLLNPFSFMEIGKDGVTREAQFGSCLDFTRHLPSDFGINQKYTGLIEIVVPEASGIIALQDSFGGGGGWEWTY